MTDAIEKLRAWLATPEGKDSLRAFAEDSRKARAKIERDARVPDDLLRLRVTF